LNPSLSCGFVAGAMAGILGAGTPPALAQSYPVKPIRIIAAPNRLNQGSGGGSPAHLAAELFEAMTGVQMTHVPFKRVAPGVMAVVAGQIDLTFASIVVALPQAKAQRLRALAVSTPRRSQIVPDVPTVAEAGVPATMSRRGSHCSGRRRCRKTSLPSSTPR
jgi:tripartite-type tricarboxylate transporter receptor subunit TctC